MTQAPAPDQLAEPLDWTAGNNGVHSALSTICGANGERMKWYIGGGASHWGVTLAYDKTGRTGRHVHVDGDLDAAKQAAQEFENENEGQRIRFPRFTILATYVLRTGVKYTTETAEWSDPFDQHELNEEALRLAKKWQRKLVKGKMLRVELYRGRGAAAFPASEVGSITISQVDETGTEVRTPGM